MENKMDLIITFCTAVVNFLNTFEKNEPDMINRVGYVRFLDVLDSVQHLGYLPWYHRMIDMLCHDKYAESRKHLDSTDMYILLDFYTTASNIVNGGRADLWNDDLDYRRWMECTYFDEKDIDYYERNKQYWNRYLADKDPKKGEQL